MERSISRREAVTGAAAGAVAVGVTAGAQTASAASGSVKGSWRITPQLPEGVPPFVALAAFAAGGVFVTTGSDEPGTGIGHWSSTGGHGFSFSYTNFHFDSSGALSNIVDVEATGTFQTNKLRGNAELRRSTRKATHWVRPRRQSSRAVA